MTQVATPATTAGKPSPAQRRLRLLRIVVLVIAATIAARLVWLQTAQSDQFATAARAIQTDVVSVPAPRGEIVDRNGVILAGNRTTYEVRVEPGTEREVLKSISQLSDATVGQLSARTLVCGEPGAQPGTCYRGEPGRPIPVLTDVPVPQALAIADAELPGVSVEQAAVRDYPSEANAAQMLGYLTGGQGKSGLEAQYDSELRGADGTARRELTRQGGSTTEVTEPAVPGKTLVTSLDTRVQAVAEQALAESVQTARAEGYEATGGSVVVMDARTGAILALASYPTYDPNIWAHGVSDSQYARLTDENGGQPLVLRPAQGLAPPASTFKTLTAAAAIEAGYDPDALYGCPSSVVVGGQTFRNYDSKDYGAVDLARALSLSCDTTFYRIGYQMWKRDGGLEGRNATEDVVRTARDFGLGDQTGVDLPSEIAGSLPDRAQVREEYDARKDDFCRRARTGYPEEQDRARARLLKAYARDYCRSGDQYKAGDAMNTAIGQGRTLTTPLQVATAYAAVANGGTLVTPHIGTGVRSADGSFTDIEPGPRGRVQASAQTLDYLRTALADTTVNGTARGAFFGFPQDEFGVAAKTGTAEVAGRQSTSWFASFAPADDPRYVVVVNVDEGGLGAATSGPVARAVYEELLAQERS